MLYILNKAYAFGYKSTKLLGIVDLYLLCKVFFLMQIEEFKSLFKPLDVALF